MIGNCKLCQRSETLRFSHIVPEFCYKPLYDGKHRAVMLDADTNHRSYVQKGIREYLLCDSCEARLNKLEVYFKKFWYDGPAIPSRTRPGAFIIRGFDYAAFKLFHLSILWRASVSSLPEFDSVNLGPHEEVLRCTLLSADPGPEDRYPFYAIAMLDDGGAVQYGMVSKPHRSRLGFSTAYYMNYAGCDWYFIVNPSPRHFEISDVLVGRPRLNGTMAIAVRNWRESISIKSFRPRPRVNQVGRR
jgi:hypothetical protein